MDSLDKHLLVTCSYILVLYLWCMCRVLYRALVLRLRDLQRVIWCLGRYLQLGIYDLESRYVATASDGASASFSSASFCSVPFKCDSESFAG